MQIIVDGKTVELKPGQKFISNGKVFGLCSACLRIIRLDGWARGWHLCENS